MRGLGCHLEAPRRVRAVDLAVGEHVSGGAAHLLLDADLRDRLDPVVRNHSSERPDPGGVVLLRLARLGPERGRCQSDRAARWAHLGYPRAVERRDRDRARARVEVADVSDRGRVEHRQSHVDRRLPGVPAAPRDGGVIEDLERDPILANAVVDLVQRQLAAVDHGLAADGGRPPKRGAGVDRERATADPGCRERLGGGRAAPVGGDDRGDRREPDDRPPHPPFRRRCEPHPCADTNLNGTNWPACKRLNTNGAMLVSPFELIE